MSADVNRLQKARRFANVMKAAGATAELVSYIDWVHVARLLGEDLPSPDTVDLIATLMSWSELAPASGTPQSTDPSPRPGSNLHAVEDERAWATREFGRSS